MKKIKFLFYAIFSFPKTLFFNLRAFPLRTAIKLPVFIGCGVRILEIHKGVIDITDSKITKFIIRFGWGGSKVVPKRQRASVSFSKGSKTTFHGRACFASGSVLDVTGNLSIGRNFSCNKNAFISCSKSVIIQNDVMLGWDVNIFDASGHTVYVNSKPTISQKEIVIGNHVWLCSKSQILKGAVVGDGSIVGWGSIVTRRFIESNVLIAGNPAAVKKENVSWGSFIM